MAISGKLKFFFVILGIAYVAAIVSFFIGKAEQDKAYEKEREYAVEKLGKAFKAQRIRVRTEAKKEKLDEESAKKVLGKIKLIVLADMKANNALSEFPKWTKRKSIPVLMSKVDALKLETSNGLPYYFPEEDCKILYNAVKKNIQGDKLDKDGALKATTAVELKVGGVPLELAPAKMEEAYDKAFDPKGNVISLNYTTLMQILNFLIFVSVMFVLLWKPVVDFLDKRRAEIRGNIDGAEAKHEESKDVLAQYHKKLDDARGETMAIIEHAHKEAQIERGEIIDKAQHEANYILEKSNEQIEAETVSAKQKLREEIAKLTSEVATKVIEREVKEADHGKFINDFVKDV